MERDGDMRGALRRGAGGGARGGGAGRGHGRGSHATGRSGPSRMRIEIARTGRTACCTAHRGTGAVRAPQRRETAKGEASLPTANRAQARPGPWPHPQRIYVRSVTGVTSRRPHGIARINSRINATPPWPHSVKDTHDGPVSRASDPRPERSLPGRKGYLFARYRPGLTDHIILRLCIGGPGARDADGAAEARARRDETGLGRHATPARENSTLPAPLRAPGSSRYAPTIRAKPNGSSRENGIHRHGSRE
jgi:hypothetical protein